MCVEILKVKGKKFRLFSIPNDFLRQLFLGKIAFQKAFYVIVCINIILQVIV